jgi:hypothetical protein
MQGVCKTLNARHMPLCSRIENFIANHGIY